MEFKAFEYQQNAIDFMVPKHYCNAFLPMGAGKTACTLEVLSQKAKKNLLPPGHILVIAPKNIARSTWPDELEKWDQFKHIHAISLIEKPNGVQLTKKKRDEIIDNIPNEEPSMYFINRELFPYLVEESLKKFNGKWLFPTIIIDELQSFKSYSSQRFKSLKKILPQTYVRIGLTGTPCSESLEALWAETYFLDGGQRLGKNISAFRNKWFIGGRLTPQGYPYEWLPRDGAEEDIIHQIKDITFSIDIPDNQKHIPQIIPIKYKMSDKEQKVYKKLLKDKILNEDSDAEISAENAAVLAGKLLQASSGAIYPDNDKSIWETLHRLKLDMIHDIVNNEQGKPIIIFYWFNHEKARLLKEFPDAKVFSGSQEDVKRWNNKDPEYKLMLCHPASSGHGLNLQYGGHIAIYMTLPWSLELYSQSKARLARTGQKEQVIIYQCIVKGTIDEKISAMLAKKDAKQQNVLNAVAIDSKSSPLDKIINNYSQNELDDLINILTEIKNEE